MKESKVAAIAEMQEKLLRGKIDRIKAKDRKKKHGRSTSQLIPYLDEPSRPKAKLLATQAKPLDPNDREMYETIIHFTKEDPSQVKPSPRTTKPAQTEVSKPEAEMESISMLDPAKDT